MAVNIKALHADLRGALQAPKKNKEGWEALLGLLRPLYPDVHATIRKRTNEATYAQIEEEVLPAVEQELDRGWPARLRAVSIYEHPRIKQLGRTLHISFYGSSMQQYGALHGKKYANTALSKKQIGELMPHWMGQGRYEGFVLSYVDKLHWDLIAALIKASGAPLKHLKFDHVSPPLQRTPTYRYKVEEMEQLMDQLIDACGQTLESFGVTLNGSPRPELIDCFYRPLIRRVGALPRLRALSFPPPADASSDVFAEVLGAFEQLDELSFPQDLAPHRARALAARLASLNLRRVGVGYLNYYNFNERLDIRELLHAPNLAHVEAWDVRKDQRDDEGWQTEEAALWRAEQRGKSAAISLDQELVDLYRQDQQQTRETLFDGATLRPSARLKALRISNINDADVARLIAQAPAAWPALECLVFTRSMSTGALHAAWAASPLLDRLTFLDWRSFDEPAREVLRSMYDDRATQQAARMEYLERALDAALHPFMAYRLWRAVREEALTRQPDRVALADALGLPKPYPKEPYELLAACEQRFIALRGGEDKMLRAGPTYASSDEGSFRWP